MALKAGLVVGLAATVIAGSVGWSTLLRSDPRECPRSRPDHTHVQGTKDPGGAGHSGMSHSGMSDGGTSDGEMDGHVVVGPTCNVVEMVDPFDSTYVPDVSSASPADRARAREILAGVNRFCATHSAAEVMSDWSPGSGDPAKPTHYFNPDPSARGLDPANPRAALIYDGEVGGVMFVGRPLPTLGSIPRAHSHDHSMTMEMVHVYCSDHLRDAYTPSRPLGLEADRIALRQRMRPAVNDLEPAELRAVRGMVRTYAGSRLAVVEPVAEQPVGGPDPVLQAMRIEIRQALMELDEDQLRRTWSLMRSR